MERLVDLFELRERVVRMLNAEPGLRAVVATHEQKYLPGVLQAVDEELEDAWLKTVTSLDEEGFPIQVLRPGAANEDQQAAAQAQADASGRRVRYGTSTAFPMRTARTPARGQPAPQPPGKGAAD